jgi:ankyrin repeat protein
MPSFGLVEQNASGTASNDEMDSSTPWMAASEGNLPRLQNALSTLNLPVIVADENGYTLLHAASAYAQVTIIEWLLTQNVNVNATDNDGDSALHHTEDAITAKFLVERGRIDPTLRNSEGKTSLQAKQDDLNELMTDEEDDSEEASKLRELIAYLESIAQ